MKEIKLAVVGLGAIARTHIGAMRALPTVRKPEVMPVLHTLVTRRPADVMDEAKAMGFAVVTDDLEAALANVDAVDICTPNALHRGAVEAAVAAGKAIYCEKPLSSNLADATAMAEAVAASGVVAQVALNYRYHPAVLRLKALLDAGAIGELFQFRVTYNHSGYLNAQVNKGWRSQAELSGGGALLDLGVHAIDFMQLLVGPLWLHHAETRTLVRQRVNVSNVSVDDWALLHVETEAGVPGVVETSRVALGAECQRVELYGAKGSLVVDLATEGEPRLCAFDGTAPVVASIPATRLLPPARLSLGRFVDTHQASLYHFLLRVAGVDPAPGWAPGFADALAAERLVYAALARQG
ncbi:MAG TPA: Gfo/Idh/MocA family oxidoreductase [Symbiobacteriaceae bacterium]|nr:Gfo/Idh/MocA family oxidoreductase [Symbiobacteriaceae bacterium]